MTRNPITDGETVLAPLFGSILNAHGAEAILNGVAPSVGTGDFDVDTTAGDVFINGTSATVGSNTASLTTPANDADLDSGEFRVDLLTVNSSGTVNVAEGVAATQPITEDIPTDEAVICAVLVSGDANSLTSADIRDYRTLLEDDAARYVDGGPHEVDAAEFAGGQGTTGQILESDGSAASWVDKRQLPDTTHTFFTGSGAQTSDTTWVNPQESADMFNFNFSFYSAGTADFTFWNDNTSGTTAEIRLRDVTNSSTIAYASTTSNGPVQTTDTTLSIPPGDADVELQYQNTEGGGVITTKTGLTLTV